MKVKIQRERLLKPLGYVANVVEKRQTLPILGNVYLKLAGGSLTVIGTDLETEVMSRIDQVTGEDGECTVTARKFYDICRTLREDAELELASTEGKTTIKSGRSRFTLQSLSAVEFPRVDVAQWDTSLELAQNALHGLLERTAFAMAQQDVRYYLNGLLLEAEGDRIRAVATDGHRLAKTEAKLAKPVTVKQQVIVPRKAIMELIRFLGEGDEAVTVEINPNHIRIRTGAVVFTSKLIDGRFPDYDKVIPAALDTHIKVVRSDFHEILARTAILTNEKFRGVRITLTDGKMTVSAHNPDQEEATDEMPVDYSGEALEIGFNVSYLMDALKALGSEEVDFGAQDPSSSCTLITPGDPKTLYLVMPMRL